MINRPTGLLRFETKLAINLSASQYCTIPLVAFPTSDLDQLVWGSLHLGSFDGGSSPDNAGVVVIRVDKSNAYPRSIQRNPILTHKNRNQGNCNFALWCLRICPFYHIT